MKEIIFDLLSVGKPAKAFSLNPEVKRADAHIQSCAHRSAVCPPGHVTRMSIPAFICSLQSARKAEDGVLSVGDFAWA